MINVWDRNVPIEESNYYHNKKIHIYNPSNYKTKNKPTAIEFFSGAGGLSLGLEMAGFNTILGNDIHMPSVETFRHNFKNSYSILGDIVLSLKESNTFGLTQ